jgi:hypothetical protein
MYGIGSNMWAGFKVKVGTYSVPGACGFGYALHINCKFHGVSIPSSQSGRSAVHSMGVPWI